MVSNEAYQSQAQRRLFGCGFASTTKPLVLAALILGLESMTKVRLLLLISLLTGCAVGYQPYNLFGGGFKDEAISENEYFVSYEAYGNIDPAIVLERWHIRANELCPDGYDVKRIERDDIPTYLQYGTTYDPKYVGEIECKN